MDPNFKAAGALNASGLPTTILIDVKGREMGRLVGDAEWDTAGMISFFKGIMADQIYRQSSAKSLIKVQHLKMEKN